jgi:hypothetical protein
MESTDLRDEFFRLARQDPYSYMLQRMWTEAWVAGYERALIEVKDFVYQDSVGGVDELANCKSRYERREDAVEDLTGERQKSAEVMALAAMGTKLERMAAPILDQLLDPKRIEREGIRPATRRPIAEA